MQQNIEPLWLRTLREKCRELGQAEVARRIKYSSTIVSLILHGKYTSKTKGVEKAVLGAFQGATCKCPVWGEIPAEQCQEHQRRPHMRCMGNLLKQMCYQACRNKCPHSTLPDGDQS